MSIVLAALDATAAARPVVATATRIGDLTGLAVEAVHVADGGAGRRDAGADHLDDLAARAGSVLRRLEGPVGPTLLGAIADDEVALAVLGARATPGGRRPVGRTARHVLVTTGKPVVVVPPEAVAPDAIARLLVPLEGTKASSVPILEGLWPLLAREVEVTVLHVFTQDTLPAMLDRPHYDTDLLGREFLARYCPEASSIVLRPGPVAARVAEVSSRHGTDLVVLSWSQVRSPERAEVVRAVLGASAVPVLLLPAPGARRAGRPAPTRKSKRPSSGPADRTRQLHPADAPKAP